MVYLYVSLWYISLFKHGNQADDELSNVETYSLLLLQYDISCCLLLNLWCACGIFGMYDAKLHHVDLNSTSKVLMP